ncbi:hypothetical protein PFISCL1PPCAC_26399, partial [Pristionchus fissidentatus]
YKMFALNLREYVVRICETVDDRRPIRKELLIPDDTKNLHNKWTFPTSLLYVLTVLTTCGYGEVSVDTEYGKIFSVSFAFLGIPLMFITAADIGKFLSETLIRLVNGVKNLKGKLISVFCYGISGRRLSIPSSTGNTDMLDIFGVNEEEEKLWFPICEQNFKNSVNLGAYVGCISGYCALGSFMFMRWESNWSFLHAFHFGFNLIVTVGLGDIVVKDYIFLWLIVAFVEKQLRALIEEISIFRKYISGLSVMTMCVDLASTHLKAYFTRIHYFGRAKRFLGMSEELKEIVALLGAMRRKKGGKVTWTDIVDFLTNELRDRPYEPRQLLNRLKFIDDTRYGMSTIRYNSLHDFFRESAYIRRLHALQSMKKNVAVYL